MMRQALADGEACRRGQIACKDWQILQRPAAQVERWRPAYRAEAEARCNAFSSDYRRKNGKASATSACH